MKGPSEETNASPISMSTPMRLESLPDELLDCICRHARSLPTLPKYGPTLRSTWFWDPPSRYMMEMRFPPPSTFVALRLVSKCFHRIATPYMWETLDVQPRHRVDHRTYLRTGKPREAEDWKKSRNSIGVLDYIVSNPHLASMVRVLCLRVSSYTFSAAARGDTEDNLERCIERLLDKTTSLTAICLDKADLLTSLAVSALISRKTLRLVDLRTVNARGEALQLLSKEDLGEIEWFGLSVFNLAYKTLQLPKNLRRVSLHCDSMSTFVRSEAVVLDQCVSVSTIEELAIFDKHGDVALFVSKHFESASLHNQQIALKDLFLDLEWCQPTRLQEVLSSFRGPTLENLTIRNLHRLDPRGLSEIVKNFPNVRQLALTSSTTDIVPAWIAGCFHAYVDALKGAKQLEGLEWDSSALCYFDRETEEDSDAFDASLAVLMKLPSLKRVHIISFMTCIVTTCVIRRDERGVYKGYGVSKTDIFPDFETSQRIIGSLYR